MNRALTKLGLLIPNQLIELRFFLFHDHIPNSVSLSLAHAHERTLLYKRAKAAEKEDNNVVYSIDISCFLSQIKEYGRRSRLHLLSLVSLPQSPSSFGNSAYLNFQFSPVVATFGMSLLTAAL